MRMSVTVSFGDTDVVLDAEELAMIAQGMFAEFGIAGVQEILAKHGFKLEEGTEPTEMVIQSVEVVSSERSSS